MAGLLASALRQAPGLLSNAAALSGPAASGALVWLPAAATRMAALVWPLSTPAAADAAASALPGSSSSSTAPLISSHAAMPAAPAQRALPFQRRASHMAMPAPFSLGGVRGMSSDSGDVSGLAEKVEALEARLVRLEGAECARRTLAGVVELVDRAAGKPELITQEEVLRLFSHGAIVDMGDLGASDGADEVTLLLKGVAASLRFSRTFLTNVSVTVQEDDPSLARATAYLLTAATSSKGEDGWGMEAVRVQLRRGFEGEWKVRKLKWSPAHPTVFTPYSGPGWSTAPNVLAPDALGTLAPKGNRGGKAGQGAAGKDAAPAASTAAPAAAAAAPKKEP